jgi:thiosulfate/3-mercaptopyruvate sulfurtransferase
MTGVSYYANKRIEWRVIMKKMIAIVLFLIIPGLLMAQDALVSTDWVAGNLNNPDVRIIEVSVEPGKFERGHIQGAANLRWHTDLVSTIQRDIVSKKDFEALMSRLGVENSTTVVLYGDNNNWFAAWGAWVFDMYGHPDVRLMDGGRNKWEQEKRPMSSRPARFNVTGYTVDNPNKHLRARIADVLEVVNGESEASLVDIRSADEFSGRVIAPEGVQELAIRAGHIPGAVNVTWNRLVNPEDGTFRPVSELKQIYSAEGIDGSKPIIVYCRIGERSSHTWFALSRLLGYEVRNYDGSWTEYGNAVGVPVNNPAGTVWTGK